MHYVYVIKREFPRKTYVGSTQNLEVRVRQHNSRLRDASKWKIIHSESFPTKILAMKREKFFKTGDGRKALRLKRIL